MLNYVKSELYRLFRDKSYWIFILVFVILSVSASVVLFLFNQSTPDFPYANTRFYLLNLKTSLVIPFVFIYIISKIIVEDEIKYSTLKNTVSFGISRSTIYFGKWIVSLIGLAVIGAITVVISVLSGYLLLENSGNYYLSEFTFSVLGTLPLMIAGLTTFHFLYNLSASSNYVVMIYSGIYFLPEVISRMLSSRFTFFSWVHKYNVFHLMIEVKNEGAHRIMAGNTSKGMITCYLVGGIFTLLFLIWGYYVFKKKDLK